MASSAQLRVKLSAGQTGANAFGGPTFSPTIDAVLTLANGTGVGQFDIPYFAERTVNASSNDDLDLAGVLTGAFGTTLTMAELVAIVVVNAPIDATQPPNVSNLTLGGGSNPFLGFLGGTTPIIGPIGPGGFFVIACGGAAGIGTVAAGTGDIFRVANGAGGAAKYQIAALARSA